MLALRFVSSFQLILKAKFDIQYSILLMWYLITNVLLRRGRKFINQPDRNTLPAHCFNNILISEMSMTNDVQSSKNNRNFRTFDGWFTRNILLARERIGTKFCANEITSSWEATNLFLTPAANVEKREESSRPSKRGSDLNILIEEHK